MKTLCQGDLCFGLLALREVEHSAGCWSCRMCVMEMLYSKPGQKLLGIGLPEGCCSSLLPNFVYIWADSVPISKDYFEFLADILVTGNVNTI